MKKEIDAFNESYEMDSVFQGMLDLSYRTSKMAKDESRVDVLDFAYDILIYVNRIAKCMQCEDEIADEHTKILCNQLETTVDEIAKEVFERIEMYSNGGPSAYNTLQSFQKEYKAMDAHIKSINKS